MSRLNIYLDIDGVLLSSEGRAASYADDFIRLVLSRWPDSTYWLTTHYWRGQNTTRQVLEPALKPATLRLLDMIKPTTWGDLKTDGINFKQPFLWFDDDLYEEEREILKHYDALECHRNINLQKDPMQLLDEIAYLKNLA